jgi:hypothetical protein
VGVPAENKDAIGPSNEAQRAEGTGGLDWRRSSLCGNHGSCVEVAETADGRYAVRDGEAPAAGPVLFFSHDEWDAFVAGVKAGEFG